MDKVAEMVAATCNSCRGRARSRWVSDVVGCGFCDAAFYDCGGLPFLVRAGVRLRISIVRNGW